MSTVIDEVFATEIEKINEATLEKVTSYTLADAIRGGSQVTKKMLQGWGRPGEACALTAAAIHIRAMQEK